jgi:hypothetical protein
MRLWLVGLIAVTLGLGALATWLLPTQRTDRVSAQEVDSRRVAFTQARRLPLQSVAVEQIDNALSSMRLEPASQKELRRLLPTPSTQQAAVPTPAPNRSEVRLVQLTLWDTHDQDGDVVAIVSAGYRREVLLTNAPQTIVIPVDDGAQVQIVGVRDGGGGITLGVRGSDSQVLLPIMSEGQTLTLPTVH